MSLVWETNGRWAAHRVQWAALRVQWWESGDEAWSEDESVSSNGSRKGNVGNDALHVIGLCGPGDKISLFFQDWELAKVAKVALSCHMAMDVLCPEMHEVQRRRGWFGF